METKKVEVPEKVSTRSVVSSKESMSSKEVVPTNEYRFDRTLHVYSDNRSCLEVRDSDRKTELYVLRRSKLFKQKGDPDYTIIKSMPDGANKNSVDAIVATTSPSIFSRSYDICLHGTPLTVKLNNWLCCDPGVKYVSRHRDGNTLSWERTTMVSERWELLNCGPSGKKKGAIEKLGRIEMGIWALKKVGRIHLPSWVDGDFLDEIVTTGLGVIEGELLVYQGVAATA